MIDRTTTWKLIDASTPELRPVIGLSRFVGLTAREIVGLMWDDIEAEALLVTIGRRSMPRCLSRSCRPITTRRIVPLHMDSVAVLNDEMERQLNSRVTPFVVAQQIRVVALRNGMVDSTWDAELMDVARRADVTIDEHPLADMRAALHREWCSAFGAHVADAWMGHAPAGTTSEIGDEMLATASHFAFT